MFERMAKDMRVEEEILKRVIEHRIKYDSFPIFALHLMSPAMPL